MAKSRYRPDRVLRVRTSRKRFIPLYSMAAVLLGTVIVIKYRGLPLSPFYFYGAIAFAVLVVKYVEVLRFNDWYEVNPAFLVHSNGIFNRNERNVNFGSISDLDVKQNLWQIIFGYGDIHVRLFSADTTTLIKGINHPKNFAQFLEDTIVRRNTGGK